MIRKYIFIAALTLLSMEWVSAQTQKNLVLVGGYTEKMGWVEGTAKGISVYEFDLQTGKLSLRATSDYIKNPSYLVIHPKTKNVYAVSEVDSALENVGGELVAYHFDPQTFKFKRLNAVSSNGTSPCFVSIDKTGRYALVANYGSGSVAAMRIEHDGKLIESQFVDKHVGKGPAPQQTSAHAHNIIASVNNKYLYSNDLGSDKVFVYNFDAKKGSIEVKTAISTVPGAGPRQMVFHPSKNLSYSVNELNGTIDVFEVDTVSGNLRQIQTISTLVKNKKLPASSADIRISPSGRFLYASNRAAHNSIVVYRIDNKTGKLILVGSHATLGKTPRFFTFDPSGKYILIANQDSNNVVVYKINQTNGLFVEPAIISEVPTPTCLMFY
jgi:6-phosphogluconolactonase